MLEIQNTIGKTIFFILVSLILFVSFAQTTHASGAYGWFSPKVMYINDTTTESIGCSDDEASIEFWLAESGTQSQISGNSGSWWIKVRNSKTDLTARQSLYFSAGEKVSSPVCFKPNENGLQIHVTGSASYHSFNGPTLFPGVTDLSSMKGKHFRGFLELEPKTKTLPSVQTVTADGVIFNGQPTLEVVTNTMPASYGANAVVLTRFYLVNQNSPSTVINYTRTGSVTLGEKFAFTPLVSASQPALPEGIYFWTFQQEFNGATTTKSPGFAWGFSQIPSSGAPDPLMSFIIDKSAPESDLTYSVESISSTAPITAKVLIKNTVSDKYSPLGSSVISVYNTSGMVATNNRNFPAAQVNGVHAFSPDLPPGDYTVIATTTDSAGNTQVISKSISIPLSYSTPTISNEVLTTSIPRSISANINSNNSTVDKWGTCWSATNLAESDFLTSANAVCVKNSGAQTGVFGISDEYNSLPVGSTIYMFVYAHNLGGTSTKIFIDSITSNLTNSLPAVKFASPSIVQANFIDPGVQILSVGDSTTGLIRHGICWFLDETVRTAFVANPASLSAFSTNCSVWNNTAEPNLTPYRFDISSLPNTVYFFKVFAENGSGIVYDSGQVTTLGQTYEFVHLSNNTGFKSPDILYDKTIANFNEDTGTFNRIRVRTVVVDMSTDVSATPPRTVNFIVRLIKNGVVLDTKNGSVSANLTKDNPPNTSIASTYFDDVPLGSFEVNVEFTGATDIPLSAPVTFDSKSKTFILEHPNISLETITGENAGVGSVLVVDPQLKLKAMPSLIRSGQSTTLEWEMSDVGVDLQCEIAGPKTFSPYTFTANLSNNLTGKVSSEPLLNNQFFRLKCINGTYEFATTTRVNTIGTVQEI